MCPDSKLKITTMPFTRFLKQGLILLSLMPLMGFVDIAMPPSNTNINTSSNLTCLPPIHKRTSSKITNILGDKTFKLKNNQIIQLSGLYIPTIVPNARKTPQRALSIKKYLKSFALGQNVFYKKQAPKNRYDHLITPLYLTKNKKSLQEVLIQQGHGLYYALYQPIKCLTTWKAAEKQARTLKKGIWSHHKPLILPARPVKNLNWKTQRFHIIEGRVHTIGQSKSKIYLNFEKNWHKDFTVSILKKTLKNFGQARSSIMQLAGQKIRVRGWLEWRNGPMINLEQIDNLEFLEK